MRMYKGNIGKLCFAHSFHTVVFHSTHKVIIAQKISHLLNPTLRLQQTEISTSPSYFRVLYPSPFASSLQAKPFIWKWVPPPGSFICRPHSCIFIWKVLHEDSFWNRGTSLLGNGLCNNYKNIVLCKNGSTKIVRRFHCRYLEELRSKKIFTKRFHNFNENFSWSSNNKLYKLAREHIAGDCLPKKILKQKNKIFIYLALLQYKPNMKREAKLVLSPDTWPSPRFHDSSCLAAPRFLKMTGVTWQAEKRLIGW